MDINSITPKTLSVWRRLNGGKYTKEMILIWLKINGGKYIINTYEDDGGNIYYLLDNGTWKATNTHGFHGPDLDDELTFESKVFNSIDEAKDYLEKNGVYVSGANKVIPLSQLQTYIDDCKVKVDQRVDGYFNTSIAICFDKIPTEESCENIKNMSFNDMIDCILENIYDPDSGNEEIEFA